MSDTASASSLPESAGASTPDPAPLPHALPTDVALLAAPAAEAAGEPPADAAPTEPAASDEAAAAAASEPAADAVTSPAACGARLQALFPALFAAERPKPLKLRIQADIQARAPGVFSKPLLSAFLHRYTTGTAYLNVLSRATERFDLDGQPAGELSEEHRAAATEEVKRRRALRDERIAKEREAAREAARTAEREARRASADARRAQEAAERAAESTRREEDDARRERARLLRDYEATRLTRTNFCVLKGLPEAQLDGLLEQARREAVEWAAQRAARESVAERRDAGASRGQEQRPPRPGRRDDRRPEGGRPERGDARRGDRREAGRPQGRPQGSGGQPPRRDGEPRPARPAGDRPPRGPAVEPRTSPAAAQAPAEISTVAPVPAAPVGDASSSS